MCEAAPTTARPPRGPLLAPQEVAKHEARDSATAQRRTEPAAAGSHTYTPSAPDAELAPGSGGGVRRRPEEFVFLHHYAGRVKYGLGEAVVEEATERGLRARHASTNLARDPWDDLRAEEPYRTHRKWASELRIHGHHAGYPCTSFSRVRFRPMAGMPRPVRNVERRYGFPWNSP